MNNGTIFNLKVRIYFIDSVNNSVTICCLVFTYEQRSYLSLDYLMESRPLMEMLTQHKHANVINIWPQIYFMDFFQALYTRNINNISGLQYSTTITKHTNIFYNKWCHTQSLYALYSGIPSNSPYINNHNFPEHSRTLASSHTLASLMLLHKWIITPMTVIVKQVHYKEKVHCIIHSTIR